MNISIRLHMPLYLQQYLRNFLTKKGHGYYLSRENNIGKYINALIDYPEDYLPDSADGIQITLPYHPGKINPCSRNYISKENQQRLIDYLASTFDLEFRWWVTLGVENNIPYNNTYEYYIISKGIDL